MFLKSLGVRKLLVIAVSLMVLLSTISGIAFIWSKIQSNEFTQLQSQIKTTLESLGQLDHAGLGINLAAMDAIVDAASQTVDSGLKEELAAEKKRSEEIFTRLKSVNSFPEVLAAVPQFEGQLNSLVSIAEEIFKLIETRKATSERLGELDDQIDSTRTNLSQQLDALSAEAKKSAEAQSAVYVSRLDTVYYLNILALIATVFCAVFLVGQTTLHSTKHVMHGVNQLAGSKMTLEKGAFELESRAARLAQTVNHQSAGVTETVAAVTQIQSIIKRNNENLSRASKNLTESSQAAADGLQNSSALARTLQNLSSTSQELQKIIEIVAKVALKLEVINGIVFKTQVLAFNASIEAARAGEHGKGFSVVAQEVGRLADMSGSASNEINQLVEDSKSQVAQILNAVTDQLYKTIEVSGTVKTNFEGLAHRVNSIADSIIDIETGAKEQETGLEQCSKSMHAMNTATAEIAAAAKSITEQCTHIRTSNSAIARVAEGLQLLMSGQQANFNPNPQPSTAADPTQSTTYAGSATTSENLAQNEEAKTLHLLEKLRKKDGSSKAS